MVVPVGLIYIRVKWQLLVAIVVPGLIFIGSIVIFTRPSVYVGGCVLQLAPVYAACLGFVSVARLFDKSLWLIIKKAFVLQTLNLAVAGGIINISGSGVLTDAGTPDLPLEQRVGRLEETVNTLVTRCTDLEIKQKASEARLGEESAARRSEVERVLLYIRTAVVDGVPVAGICLAWFVIGLVMTMFAGYPSAAGPQGHALPGP